MNEFMVWFLDNKMCVSIYLSILSHSLEAVGATWQWLLEPMISKALCLQLFWWTDRIWGRSSLWCYPSMTLQVFLSFFNHLCLPVALYFQGYPSIWSHDQSKLTICVSLWLTCDHAPLCILTSVPKPACWKYENCSGLRVVCVCRSSRKHWYAFPYPHSVSMFNTLIEKTDVISARSKSILVFMDMLLSLQKTFCFARDAVATAILI